MNKNHNEVTDSDGKLLAILLLIVALIGLAVVLSTPLGPMVVR